MALNYLLSPEFQIVNALPASPVSTVLYIIPET